MELTDLEICKRIAEIEGYPAPLKAHNDNWIIAANPLTDDALCFKLMVKYNVDIVSTPEVVHAVCFGENFSNPLGSYGFSKNHNKAIIESIIEAHKND